MPDSPKPNAPGTPATGADAAAPAAPAATAPASAAAAPPPEPQLRSRLPVLGGRMGVGVALLTSVGFISWNGMNACIDRTLYPQEPKPAAEWAAGTEANVEITLITADSRRLNCAHDQVIEGLHCAFNGSKRPWPRAAGALADDNDENVIQPFRTADTNALILVAGLWAQPALAMRLHREPPALYDTKKQIRFVAYCKVKFVGELKEASLRWDTGAKWTDNQSAMVAKPLRCSLEKSPDVG